MKYKKRRVYTTVMKGFPKKMKNIIVEELFIKFKKIRKKNFYLFNFFNTFELQTSDISLNDKTLKPFDLK